MAEDKDNSIEKLRALPIPKVFELLGLHFKTDSSYKPKKAQAQRFYVSMESGEVVELLVIGEQWYDARATQGGGGAIDLVMHLYGEGFPQAVRRLQGELAPQRKKPLLLPRGKATKAPKGTNGEPEDKSRHLVPTRKGQGEFFLADLTGWIPKDDLTSMEHPLFALKAGDTRIRVFERNGCKLVVSPDRRYGLATIHDKDVWIYCVSQLVAAKNQGMEVNRTVRFVMYDFLRKTNRPTSGIGYQRVLDALRRLNTTNIETDIATPNYRERRGFSLIDSWRVVEKSADDGRMIAVEIDLPKWLMCSVDAMQVLTLSRDYFRLRKPIDRRIYELARKHCGQQEVWRVSVATLHQKSGSSAGVREFRRQVKLLADSNELPDYLMTYEEDTDMVTFSIRKPQKAE